MSRKFWERATKFYDLFTWGSDQRYQEGKRQVFAAAQGKTLLVGVGTGRDLLLLPAGLDLTAIDLSAEMLERARSRAADYPGTLHLQRENIEQTSFPAAGFDTVVTSCVFCSVGNPGQGLQEIRRVLRPGGRLIMFEHVLSKNLLLQPMLYLMNLFIPAGPDFTRDTLARVRAAGFRVIAERNLYMDIIKGIVAE